MLNEADTAMYQAKSAGGGRTALFDGELARQVSERSTAQITLLAALDERRVVPYYQPIIDLATGAVTGFEALARLIERDGTVQPPITFIGVAEDSGLVLPLGRQMLERACNDAVLWPGSSDGEDATAVAVNVSSHQLEPGDLTTVVRDILARTGMSAPRLHLELTETAVMDLHPEILRQLSKIRELGVQIGLDDFGTGYASLTHLRRLPLDFVKIDGSFVDGLGTEPGDERIVGAVIDLARNLGLRSIAECVETSQQLDQLRELGCDEVQGYLFARPAPPAELTFQRYELPHPVPLASAGAFTVDVAADVAPRVRPAALPDSFLSRFHRLTPREVQQLILVVHDGLSHREITEVLGTTRGNVATTMQAIRRKLAVPRMQDLGTFVRDHETLAAALLGQDPKGQTPGP
jgi:EAL domain-containing protein (putative c-di-GMP-specific phosphodiesterase class I)/DNA-binding CsgD family transcriptional regulator